MISSPYGFIKSSNFTRMTILTQKGVVWSMRLKVEKESGI